MQFLLDQFVKLNVYWAHTHFADVIADVAKCVISLDQCVCVCVGGEFIVLVSE